MPGGKVIFHIDMNSFFASCEVAENPSLKGKRVAVGHVSLDKKGMIVAATYEAKALGVKATMTVYEAEKICKDLIVIDGHYDLYQKYSNKFFDYLYKLTPNVEPASIDEGYVDVTGLAEGNGYIDLAKKIQQDILNLYGLPCSIGIAPNLFLAKMASDMKKPLGITVLRKRDVEKMLWPLPIEDMFGCGKKTCEALRPIGIKTIGDLANYKDLDLLYSVIGKNGADSLIYHAHGNGSSTIDTNRFDSFESVSNAHTFDKPVYDLKELLLGIKVLNNTVSNKLIKNHLGAKTFTFQIRYTDFKTYSKGASSNIAINDEDKMYAIYESLLHEIYDPDRPVRLIGVAASRLEEVSSENKQLTIFDDFDKETLDYEVTKMIKDLNNIYGEGKIHKGVKK